MTAFLEFLAVISIFGTSYVLAALYHGWVG